jgi:hypothetical protein
MKSLHVKAEIEGLLQVAPQFLTDQYLPRKLQQLLSLSQAS